MSALPKSPWLLTVEEYLANEEASDVRHEYVDGQIYALAGASERHQLIVLNMASKMLAAGRQRGCRVLLDGLKLRVWETKIYYPDIMISCDPTDDDPYVKERPTVVVEVLSTTTALVDRREKALQYRQLPSLLSYLLVEQDERRIERYWRDDVDAEWHHELVIGRSVPIPGIDLNLSLDEIYEGIEFESPS